MFLFVLQVTILAGRFMNGAKEVRKLLVVVMLVGLIPVVVLYGLFGSLNYFELTGAWKGVMATGPIAAYCFLVWLFQRFCLNLGGGQLFSEKETLKIETVGVLNIEGKWTGRWKWEDEFGKVHDEEEIVEITEQHGRVISGTITDATGLDARFRGEIYNRVVALYYVSRKEQRLSCGSVTVKLNGEGTAMEGEQVFHEVVSGELMVYPYSLEKQ